MADGGVGEAILLEEIIGAEAASAAGAGEGFLAGMEGVAATEGAGVAGLGLETGAGIGAGIGAGAGAGAGLASIPGVSGTTLSSLTTLNPEIAAQLAETQQLNPQILSAFQNAPTSTQLAAQYGPGTQLAQAATTTATDAGGSIVGDALKTPMPTGVPEGYTGNVARASMNYIDPVDALSPTTTAAAEPGFTSPLKGIYDVYKAQDPLTQSVMKYGGMGLGALGAVKALSKPQSVAGPERYTGPLSKYRFDPNAYTPYRYQSYAGGGPVEQMSNQNAVGTNTGFPMANMHTAAYATPYQTPVSQNVLSGTEETNVDPYTGQERLAGGGIASLGGYSDGGRLLRGPGDGMSDNIPATIGRKQPARLADGEFVVPADVVSGLGNGSTDAGAKQLYKMLDKVRSARTGTKKQGKQIDPSKYTPA